MLLNAFVPTRTDSDEVLFASTTPGLEPALEREARTLPGIRSLRRIHGGVELHGDKGLHQQANLCLRTACRIRLRLGTVRVESLASLSLAPYWDGRLPVEIAASVRGGRLRADALSARAREVWKLPASKPSAKRADADSEPEQLEVLLRAENDSIEVSVDSSGELLHRRGYRQEVSRAPLRETLGAGLLLLADYDPTLPLWDPMCGSGTLPIEAAWMALDRAPGASRSFAFMRWPCFDSSSWTSLLERTRAKERTSLAAQIFASDLNAGALGTARRNARRARLEGLISFERHDATTPRRNLLERGLVVANLPYGRRVGEAHALSDLHARFGAALRSGSRGWRFALLVGSTQTERELGLRIDRTIPLDNGGIACHLLLGNIE
jgi:putative N6-adenine-specific DNA methylase